MRYVIVDGSGTILRSGFSPDPLAQAGTGETAYVLTGPGSALIPDTQIGVTDGEFVALGSYTGDLPTGDLVLADTL